MMNKQWISALIGLLLVAFSGWAQESAPTKNQNLDNPKVSITVQDTDMLSVLRLLADQSDSNVVIGPEVAATQLNIDIKDVYLTDALDVILKPHGYGYRTVGETIVVDKLDNLMRVASVEPLASRVFNLKFIDATDVLEPVKAMLSERGACQVLYVAPKTGWEFNQGGEDAAATAKAQKLDGDKKKKEESASKTLIVNDIPSVLTKIELILAEIDVMPRQVEIRSYFIEMKQGDIKDVGVNLGLTINDMEFSGSTVDTLTSDAEPYGYPSDETDINSTEFNAGMLFNVIRSGSAVDLEAKLQAVEEEGAVNILSAPRILAQDNQEAAIVVGKKTPIISTKESGSATSRTITTTLEYYERIGIQLNVIPQICDNGMINMVVHPAVTEQIGTVKGGVAIDSNLPATEYPVIQTREAETRLTVHNGDTIAIGGLISDRQSTAEQKVPLLGDIPLVGRLFRRNTDSVEKIELLILLSASIQGDLHSDVTYMNQRVDDSSNKLLQRWTPEEEASPIEIIMPPDTAPAPKLLEPVDEQPEIEIKEIVVEEPVTEE